MLSFSLSALVLTEYAANLGRDDLLMASNESTEREGLGSRAARVGEGEVAGLLLAEEGLLCLLRARDLAIKVVRSGR